MVYVPAADVEGVMAPVLALIVNPAGLDVNVPPLIPAKVTACGDVRLVQNGEPAYEIVVTVEVMLVNGLEAPNVPMVPQD